MGLRCNATDVLLHAKGMKDPRSLDVRAIAEDWITLRSALAGATHRCRCGDESCAWCEADRELLGGKPGEPPDVERLLAALRQTLAWCSCGGDGIEELGGIEGFPVHRLQCPRCRPIRELLHGSPGGGR